MNAHILHISLLVLFLTIALNALPAQADCSQEQLCDAQISVEELLDAIAHERRAIRLHWQSLDSFYGESLLGSLYERAVRYVDVGSRYLLIGNLEGRLLVAYNKLELARNAADTFDPVCHCNENIQLSAGY